MSNTGLGVAAERVPLPLSVRGLAVLAVAGMVGHGLAMTITGPVLPQIMGEFAIRETAAGVLLAAGSLGFMAGCLLGGFVTDYLGLKPVLLAAWAGVVASLIAFTVSGSYPMLVAMYCLIGVGSGVIETGLNVLPAQLGAGAGMMNLIHVGYGAGALSAPLIAGGIVQGGGDWRLAYWLIAIVPAALAIRALTVSMPAAPRQTTKHEDGQPLLALLRHPLVLLSATALLFYVAAELSVSNWVVLYFGRRYGLPPFSASLSLSLFWLLILIGRLLQGPLNRFISLPALIVVNAALFGVGVVGLSLATSPTPAYVCLGVAGFGASGIYPNVMVYVNTRYARQVGAVTGVLSMMAAGGSLVFQPIIGRVAELYSLQVGFLGLAACLAVVTLSYVPVWMGRVR